MLPGVDSSTTHYGALDLGGASTQISSLISNSNSDDGSGEDEERFFALHCVLARVWSHSITRPRVTDVI